jgi:hypothetical protein
MATFKATDKTSSRGVGHYPIDRAEIEKALQLFLEPGQVVELRALHVVQRYGQPKTVAGFFDAGPLTEMAAAAAELSPRATGVYFTLNPLNPDLLARRCNRVDVAESATLAGDKDVLRRCWLLVDADPERVPGISSTDEEKRKAWSAIQDVREHLRCQGWPHPVQGDSGNGFHLLYRIDLAADDGGLVQRVLQALAQGFGSEAVKIDTTVHNPARICKLYGTWARKGDDTNGRPHRPARLLEDTGP